MEDFDPKPPAGFVPFSEPSPFLDRIGPLFEKREPERLSFGLRVAPWHCNRRQMIHGGVIATVADIALGKTGTWLADPPASFLTASLTVDLYGAAREGQWLEAIVDYRRTGRQIAFGNCYVSADGDPVARASAVFNVRRRD